MLYGWSTYQPQNNKLWIDLERLKYKSFRSTILIKSICSFRIMYFIKPKKKKMPKCEDNCAVFISMQQLIHIKKKLLYELYVNQREIEKVAKVFKKQFSTFIVAILHHFVLYIYLYFYFTYIFHVINTFMPSAVILKCHLTYLKTFSEVHVLLTI